MFAGAHSLGSQQHLEIFPGTCRNHRLPNISYNKTISHAHMAKEEGKLQQTAATIYVNVQALRKMNYPAYTFCKDGKEPTLCISRNTDIAREEVLFHSTLRRKASVLQFLNISLYTPKGISSLVQWTQ